MTFIDTNILIDIATGSPTWAEWSSAAIVAAHARGPLFTNVVVHAEFAIGFQSEAECDQEIEKFDLTWADIPRSAAFRAAEAFRQYRRAGGTRTATLPDFFIGAHAGQLGASLLTRDTRRYRAYFPEVRLIAPDGAQ